VSSNPRTEFVAVDGLRLRTVRHGEGPPLRLINGLGAPAEMWLPLVRHLADYELITFDLPGCGRSSTPAVPLGMRALGAIAAAVMERVGHPRADGLGYSLGGMVAAAWLMLTPSRHGDRGAANPIVPVIAGGRTSWDRSVLDANLPVRLAHAPSLFGYLGQLCAASGFSSHQWIRRVTQPTLVMAGDDDPLVPVSNARYLAWAIRVARLLVMPGAGHLMLIDDPRPASRLILEFLQEEIVSHGRKLAA